MQVGCATSFVRVNSGEVEVGRPVPWALYDDRLLLEFRVVVNEIEEYLSIPAVLKSVHAGVASEGDSPQVNHGVQFEELPHNQQVVLSAFVYRVLFEETAEG